MNGRSDAAPSLAFALAACTIAFGAVPAAGAAAAPSRIAVRPAPAGAGFYAVDDGRPFVPRGFNYIVVDPKPNAPQDVAHVVLTTGFYDPQAVDRNLAAIASAGFNTVRVFLDPGDAGHAERAQYGVGGPAGTTGLYGPYVDNFVDFLRRAAAHDVYVVPVLVNVPFNRSFQSAANAGRAQTKAEFPNSLYLVGSEVDAQAAYAADLVRAVKERGGTAALATVLAWEIHNEIFVRGNAAPFSARSGRVTTGDGKTYDMGDPASRQACADGNMAYWASRLARAVRTADPKALVTAGFFTYGSWRKSGPNGVMPVAGVSNDYFPGRPLALEGILSFLDVHVYPRTASYSLRDDLDTLELERWDRSRYPVVLGEFGFTKPRFPAVSDAVAGLQDLLSQAGREGIGGYLLWTWSDSRRLWSATEAGGAMLHAMQSVRW